MKKLEWVPHNEWPRSDNPARFNVWCSPDYLVQAFHEKDGVVRLSVCSIGPGCRTDADTIPWGDLQAIKAACGYGSFDALEAFPPENDVRGGAGNARYLWILPKNERLPFIWRNAGHQLGMFRELINKAKTGEQ
jgi:hypothetical protein